MLSVEIDMEKVLRHVEKVLPVQIEKAVNRSLKEATELVKTTAQQEHEYTSRTGKLEREGIATEITKNEGKVMLDKKGLTVSTSMKVPAFMAAVAGRIMCAQKQNMPCAGLPKMALHIAVVIRYAALSLTRFYTMPLTKTTGRLFAYSSGM